jgi:transcriptional regulator with XRE-family HTH domain
MTIGDTIKRLRESNKMTQAELAEQIETLQKVISDYEHGRTKPPRDRLLKIAAAFGITVDELLGSKEKRENTQSINPNSRAAKLLIAFEKLSPSEQRLILKQTQAIAEGKKD